MEKCGESGDTTSSSSPALRNNTLNDVQLKKVDILVNIAIRQVCSLERERAWPLEAITFSKIVIEIIKEIKESLKNSREEATAKVQIVICSEILKRMEIIVQNLLELGDLRKHHSIRIPFQQYMDVSFRKI